jgi:predicted RNase H-like HicB family nuclease
MKYRITLVESEEGWAVWCDDLPGCCSQGETREEAVENIRIAIQEYLEVVEEDMLKENGGRAIIHEEVFV